MIPLFLDSCRSPQLMGEAAPLDAALFPSTNSVISLGHRVRMGVSELRRSIRLHPCLQFGEFAIWQLDNPF